MSSRSARLARIALAVVVIVTALQLGAGGHTPAAHADASPTSILVPDASGEVVALRTRSSRTFVTKDGLYRADIYPGSVNYRGADGSWQPIDNTLRPISETGFRYENGQNRYQLKLPPTLRAPVRIAAGGSWIEFSLDGAGLTLGTASGPTNTYRDALPGVDVSYTASGDTVKEALTLKSASAPSTFTYTLRTSSDLTPATTAAGGIEFRDASGVARLAFAPPETQDAAGVEAPPLPLGLSMDSGAYKVTLKADAAWLAEPERSWPVVVDPLTTFYDAGSGDRDCYVWGANASTSYCSASTVNVGYDANGRRRALIYFDNLTALPKQVQVLYADLQLHLASETNATPMSVSAYPISRAWTNAATWNSAATGVPWTSAGGDWLSSPSFTNPSAGGSPGSWYHWNLTNPAQGWREGTLADNGVLLRATSEVVGNMLSFDSMESGANVPKLQVTYQYAIGERPFESFDSQPLTDRLTESVNVTNGNLLVSASDLELPGIGLDLSIGRYYNSLNSSEYSGGGELGKGWVIGTGIDVHLTNLPDGSIAYYGPSGYTVSFVKRADGSFEEPAGEDGTLVKNGDGSYTLSYHFSDEMLTFNADGLLTSQKDANGNTISFSYAPDVYSELGYRLTQVTDTRGNVTTFSYDTFGHLTKVTDASGRYVQFGYNGSWQLTSATDADGKVTRYGYTKYWLTSITDPLGDVTTFNYDGQNRVTAVTRVVPGGPSVVSRYTYNDGNTVVIDPNSHTSTYAFDGANEVTRATDPLGNADLTSWNADRKPTTATFDPVDGPPDPSATTTYDASGEKPLTLTSPVEAAKGNDATQITRLKYGDPANPYDVTKVTDPQNHSISYDYDAKGNPIKITDELATQNTATATYNPNGTVATAKDFKQNQTTYAYFPSGDLQKVTNPTPLGADTYTYDSLGRIKSSTNGNGQTVNYTYDLLDRIKTLDYVGGSPICYSYDANGNVLTMTDNNGTTTYTYDALNRLKTETPPGGPTNLYGYDLAGNLVSVTDASGTTTYTYNADDQVTTMTDPGNGNQQTVFTYWPNGTRKETIYPNGVTMTARYDASGRTTSVASQQVGSGAMLTSLSYSYTDPVTGKDTDLLQSMTDVNGNTTTYSYDALNRLIKTETKNNSGAVTDTRTYTYDGNSNRLTQDVNGTATSYVYNAADELTSAGSTTYTYNGAGYRKTSSKGLSITYNHKGQPSSILPPGGSAASYTYRGPDQSVRTQAGSTNFSNSTLGVAQETGTGTISYKRDPSGLLVVESGPSGTVYPIFDANGSIVGLTNSSGQLIDTYGYDPFGNVTSRTGTTQNPYQFQGATGAYTDQSTGFVQTDEGLYDPQTATLTQPQQEMNDPRRLNAGGYYFRTIGDDILIGRPAGAGARVPQVRPTVRGGESPAAAYGRYMHQVYNYGPGFVREFRLPSGARVDAVNFNTRVVVELKPHRASAISRGRAQLRRYAAELNREFPGRPFRMRLVTYEPYRP